eukprot:CAMPEP_0185282064 /NCGR_PEP_ID=MMETSP1359-20130426/67066_1 /TAXON_ID=552665 /ORGANISM="Bigelowiella longifila, Strain CCMP242" /LENGTH=182 /DNA_ID=CAMNT_0027877565 /DNA_START=373 /DNA_END=920 /DNA_ORIENTATION=-
MEKLPPSYLQALVEPRCIRHSPLARIAPVSKSAALYGGSDSVELERSRNHGRSSSSDRFNYRHYKHPVENEWGYHLLLAMWTILLHYLLILNGSIFNPSTSSGTNSIDGITSDSINGLTFSNKSKFEKKLTTLSDYNLSNKITNDATNGLVITANDATLEKLTLKNVVGLLENLPYTTELSK